MKRGLALFILILVLVSFSLTGCSKSQPEKTLEEFIEHMSKFEVEEMADLVVKENINRERFQAYMLDGDYNEVFKKYLKEDIEHMTYKILDTEIDKSRTTIQVRFDYIDAHKLISSIFKKFLARSLESTFTDGNRTYDEAVEALDEIAESESRRFEELGIKKEIITREFPVKLVEKDGKWYLESLNRDILNVMLSNYIDGFEDFFERMSNTDIDEYRHSSDVQERLNNIYDIKSVEVGQYSAVRDMRFRVNESEERDRLVNELTGSEATPGDGMKFLVVRMTVSNLTDKPIRMEDFFTITDTDGNSYKPTDVLALKGRMLNKIRLEAFEETDGIYIYRIPEDLETYTLVTVNKNTGLIHGVFLK